jgi:hypothetical protein
MIRDTCAWIEGASASISANANGSSEAPTQTFILLTARSVA